MIYFIWSIIKKIDLLRYPVEERLAVKYAESYQGVFTKFSVELILC